MTFKLMKDENGVDRLDAIIMIADDGQVWFVPGNLENADWLRYQAWLAEDPNNQPDPAD